MNEFSVECNGATHNADNRDDLSLLDITASLYLDNKRWMRLSLSHPPKSRRLLVVGSVSWIISGLELREPLHADGVDLGDPVLEGGPFDLILYLAIPENTAISAQPLEKVKLGVGRVQRAETRPSGLVLAL